MCLLILCETLVSHQENIESVFHFPLLGARGSPNPYVSGTAGFVCCAVAALRDHTELFVATKP